MEICRLGVKFMAESDQLNSKSEDLWKKMYPIHSRRNIDIPSLSIYEVFSETAKKKLILLQ